MKYNLLSLFLVSSCVIVGQAKTPATRVQTLRPTTTTATFVRPSTDRQVYHPATGVEVSHPSTQVAVTRPQTNVQVTHPSTQAKVLQPQTTVEVSHPQTTVQVVHPQTTVSVFHPQTIENQENAATDQMQTYNSASSGGRQAGPSSQVTTSMSDFKPKQAKNFSATPVPEKAAPLGGGSNDLGNDTNQAEKDNVNKSSMLGKQKEAQNLAIDPKQTNIQGLEQKVEEKAKEAQSKKK